MYLNLLLKFSPILLFILLEFIQFKIKWTYFIVVIINIFIFLSIFLITKKKIKFRERLKFFALPFCFLNGMLAYSMLISSKWLIHSLFILAALFVYYYFKHSYIYVHKMSISSASFLKNLAFYSSILSFFFFSSFIYGLSSFLNIPISILIGILIIFVFFVYFSIFYFYEIQDKKMIIYIIMGCVIVAELAWSLSSLPLKFFITGMALTSFFYIISGITVKYLLGELNKRAIRIYLIIGFLSEFIILLTARWI